MPGKLFDLQSLAPLQMPPTTLHQQNGRTDPVAAKQSFDTFKVALDPLFDRIEAMGHAIKRREALNRAVLDQLRRDLNTAEEDYRRLTAPPPSTLSNVVTINFTDASHQELDPSLSEGPQASIDPEQAVLTLPLVEQTNLAVQGSLRVLAQVGGELKGVSSTSLDAVLDGRPDTSWSVQIPAPGPLEIPLEASGAVTKGGAAVLLELGLPVPALINKLVLRPYATYPIDIVAILFYETNKPGETPYHLLSPNHPVPGYRTQSTSELTSFTFPDITISRVQILLNQRHYVRRERAAQRQVYYDYQYGLSGIELWSSRYQAIGSILSKPLGIEHNLRSVQILTDFEEPRLPNRELADLTITSLEYDIAPEGGAWTPILPANVSKVVGERVLPFQQKGVWKSLLRFAVAGGLLLYRNGQLLTPMVDYNVVGSTVIWNNPFISGLYTADYAPTAEAWRVTLWTGQDQDTLVTETFHGTGLHPEVTLAWRPLVNRQLISKMPDDWDPSVLNSPYVPFQVQIIQPDGSILEQPVGSDRSGLRNNTPYRRQLPYSPGPSYVVEDNVLRFSQAWNEGQIIKVTYPVGISTVRLRITVRRHLEAYEGLTPTVSRIICAFETLR